MSKFPAKGTKPEKVKKAEARLEVQPYDIDCWNVLIQEAQHRRIEDVRQFYENLMTQFPMAGIYWKLYIEHEMKSRNFEKVEALFQRCLMKVLNIDLWKTYLHYIKETKGKLPSFREKMAQAFDFALDKIGMDVMSYQLWVDYAVFLKSVQAVGSYAENQRITAVRKVYQRGVCNPMIAIEQLWKDYCIYENSINPLIAKKMIEDRGRDYVNARRVAKEYENMTKGLMKNRPSVPPQNTAEEIKQVVLWKKYIAWEKSNPLRTEDHALSTKRVMFAYEQALLCLGYHPDIWNEASLFLEQSSRTVTEKGDQNAGKLFADEAASVYERAISTVLKKSKLLHFAYADFEESRSKLEKVHSIYKKLLSEEEVDPTLVYIQYMRFTRRAQGIKAARLIFKMAREDSRAGFEVFIAAALMEYYCTKDKNVALKIFELGLKKYGEKREYLLTYLQYMSHVNEDNNTRVLYERVLTAGQLSPESTREIWNSFLEFEATVGDLASVIKVEKRRAQTLGLEQEFRETSQLIDRYKYIDLYPCSSEELNSLGYKIRSSTTDGELVKGNTSAANVDNSSFLAPTFSKPDTNQMVAFKPLITAASMGNRLEGGIISAPPAAADLMKMMPPPKCFVGPFVLIDKFVEHVRTLNLEPTEDKPESTKQNGTADTATPTGQSTIAADSRQINIHDVDPGTRFSMDIAAGRKRKIHSDKGDSDEDDSIVPPANDIYRSRQLQKRVK